MGERPATPLPFIALDGDDESIPEDALEFNPAGADLNQLFVESQPSPEWTAATGTFKAIVLKTEEAASPPTPPPTRAIEMAPLPREFEEDEIELDADFLSATAQMRKLQVGPSDMDAPATKATDHNTSRALASGTTEPTSRAKTTPPGPAPQPTASAGFSSPAAPPLGGPSLAAPPLGVPSLVAQSHSQSQSPPLGVPSLAAQSQLHAFLSETPAPGIASLNAPPLGVPSLSAQSQSQSPSPQLGVPSLVAQSRSRTPQPAEGASPAAPPRKAPKAYGLEESESPGRLATMARARVAAAQAELEASEPQPFFKLPALWAAGTALLVLVLVVQIVNHYRNDLAASPQFNKPITALYAALGIKLTPNWDLHAYDVRQLGASVDPESAGQIMVRASVKNGGRQAQPMPLLRVTLQDRFGNRIAARDVAPGSYLPRATASIAFLPAGQRIDAEMAFVDPGANAVGFEIDACLPAPAGGIICANDPVSR